MNTQTEDLTDQSAQQLEELMMQNSPTAAEAGISGVFVFIYFAVVAFMLYAMAKLFMKAGRKWWEAIIPIYNSYVQLKIVGRPGWWLLLLLIPFVNIIILIIVLNDLSKSFGGGIGTTLGLIFLPFIFIPYMAFSDKYKYGGPSVKA